MSDLFKCIIVYIREIVWFIICSYYYLYTCSSWGLACICWWWVWQSFYFGFTHSKQIWFRNTLIFNFGLFRNTFDKLLNFFRNTTVKMNCSVHCILFHLIWILNVFLRFLWFLEFCFFSPSQGLFQRFIPWSSIFVSLFVCLSPICTLNVFIKLFH